MFKVEHSVKINIDEAGLKQLIIDEIARQNPTIQVDDITFTQRRKPSTEIEVSVSGHVEGDAPVHTPVSVEVEEEVTEENPTEPETEEEADLDPASQLLADESSDDVDDLLADEEEEELDEDDPFAD